MNIRQQISEVKFGLNYRFGNGTAVVLIDRGAVRDQAAICSGSPIATPTAGTSMSHVHAIVPSRCQNATRDHIQMRRVEL